MISIAKAVGTGVASASIFASGAPGFILRASDAPLEVVPVDNDNLQEEYFRMRFDTYIGRKKYECREAYPEGRMKDPYDEHSLWSLVRHIKTGVYLGAVRFVLRPEGKILPFEQFRTLPSVNGAVAEISSFLFCRGRIKDAQLPHTLNGGNRGFGLVSLFLMKACFEMGSRHEIEAVCGLMCPVLFGMFKKEGIEFKSVPDEKGNETVEYHGSRQPCWNTASGLLKGIKAHNEDLYDLVRPRDEVYLKRLMGNISD